MIHDAREWQAAMQALLLVAEQDGPTMFARIGVMRALHRLQPKVAQTRRKRARAYRIVRWNWYSNMGSIFTPAPHIDIHDLAKILQATTAEDEGWTARDAGRGRSQYSTRDKAPAESDRG
jgi:hypothetical protein